MVKFQIPDIALPAFTKLSQLSAEETEKIGSLLKQFPLGGSIEDLHKLLSENQFFIDLPEMAETFFSFANLLTNNKETSREELAKNLSEAFAMKKKGEIGEEIVSQLVKNLQMHTSIVKAAS